MPNNYMSLTFETDMSRGISPVTIKAALVYDDNLAHNVRIKCMEKGRFQSMSGTVQAYFIRADNSTVPMNGQIVDGVPEVKLLPECYNIAGRFLFLVKITNSGSTNTIFYGTGNVLRGRTDVVIDPGEVVPSLDELLAKINELELATNASFEATERANSAAETANTAAAAADEVRQDIQSGLAGKAPAIFVTASGDLVHITDGAAMPVKSLITHIEPVQSGSGDPSPSNVRPISGWTGANMTRTGENLFDQAMTEDNKGLGAGGNVVTKSGFCVSEFIPIKGIVTCSFDTTLDGATIALYDENKNFISSVWKNLSPQTLSHESAKYLRIETVASKKSAVQVELSATASPFKPYQGTKFTAQFGQTIYGGELDWKTGVLKKTAVLQSFTGDENWIEDNWGVPVFYLYQPEVLSTVANSHFKNDLYVMDGTVIFDNAAYGYTLQEWKNYLSSQYAAGTPVQICYKVAAPEEIQLTPQQILSLAGGNNLWCDAGETEVTYAADTKMYIDQKIAAIAAAVLNN